MLENRGQTSPLGMLHSLALALDSWPITVKTRDKHLEYDVGLNIVSTEPLQEGKKCSGIETRLSS